MEKISIIVTVYNEENNKKMYRFYYKSDIF